MKSSHILWIALLAFAITIATASAQEQPERNERIEAMKISFGSTAHGAGRLMSRYQAKKDFPVDQVKDDLAKLNITVKAASFRGISEEAPGAYKDVDEVIEVSHQAGIAKKVARLKPIGVIKG